MREETVALPYDAVPECEPELETTGSVVRALETPREPSRQEHELTPRAFREIGLRSAVGASYEPDQLFAFRAQKLTSHRRAETRELLDRSHSPGTKTTQLIVAQLVELLERQAPHQTRFVAIHPE